MKPNGALCCCPGAGWSSDPLPGPPDSDAWQGITNDYPPPWLWLDGLVLGHAVYEGGFVVNAVKLVGEGSVDCYLYNAGGKFGDDHANGRGCNGIGAVGLLNIERAAGIII